MHLGVGTWVLPSWIWVLNTSPLQLPEGAGVSLQARILVLWLHWDCHLGFWRKPPRFTAMILPFVSPKLEPCSMNWLLCMTLNKSVDLSGLGFLLNALFWYSVLLCVCWCDALRPTPVWKTKPKIPAVFWSITGGLVGRKSKGPDWLDVKQAIETQEAYVLEISKSPRVTNASKTLNFS